MGLGNPGPEYENTRHNAGVWLVDALKGDLPLKQSSRFHGRHGILSASKDHDIHLLVPSTFMNHSGQSVAAVSRYYDIPADAILVAHDDIDLPVGDIRLKHDGGHGGHNGLRDIIQHLGSHAFWRLRMGVSHPGHRDDVTDHVLSTPSKQDRLQIDQAIQNFVTLVPSLLAGKFQQVMQVLHTKPGEEKE